MLTKKIIKKTTILSGFFWVVWAKQAFAQQMFSGAPDLIEIVSKFLNFLVKIIGIIGIIAFVGAGIAYLMSAGNPEIAEKAKKYFVYSIIGLVVAVGSFIILLTIDTLLRGN
ncbi:MAG: hypothetical protein GF335_02865 [Candidatus Moranbacteria bacterium]|nr:hypothetical protein [Candidatus Moranbacteria bacterium]